MFKVQIASSASRLTLIVFILPFAFVLLVFKSSSRIYGECFIQSFPEVRIARAIKQFRHGH